MLLPASRYELLRWQFDLTWSLLELHFDELTEDMLLREPAPVCWNLRRNANGRWIPDWDEAELDPIPVPTIGWLTWHIGWWWTVALDHAQGRSPRERTDIVWPGNLDNVSAWLRGLRTEWLEVIDRYTDADLDHPAAYPWGDNSDKTMAHTAAWLNAELMKNAAEIGQLRLQFAAS